MKRVCVLVLIITVLCVHSFAIAERCPLPAVNTKADIIFSGFEWYTDYKDTLAAANRKGLVNEFKWSRDNFDQESYLTPHWKTLINSINSSAGSEKGCGGYLNYSSNIPNVAGYKVSNLKLYFMWNPDKGPASDYTAKDACQFYMARYEFDVSDNQAAYRDLVAKLKTLYGTEPHVDTDGCGTDYTVWVNLDQALVGISVDEYYVVLIYCAPDVEDKLAIVEQMAKTAEINNAAGDLSGL